MRTVDILFTVTYDDDRLNHPNALDALDDFLSDAKSDLLGGPYVTYVQYREIKGLRESGWRQSEED